MILSILFITFLLKINFLSCQFLSAPFKTGYNQVLARYLFILTADSYSKFPGKCMPQLVPFFKSYNFIYSVRPPCDSLKNICSFYLLADKTTKTMIIVFSGAQSKSQVFYQALTTFQKRINFFKMGEVNKYFINAHIILWNYLEQIIKSPLYSDYKFLVVGHSFGGALAALAALRIQIMNIKRSKDIILYTYGEPRVGNLLFATNFDLRVPQSYRIVNGYDFIAHLPPCTKMKLRNSRDSLKKKKLPCSRESNKGYYHHGTEIWYPRGSRNLDKFYECFGAPKNEDFRCSDGLILDKRNYKTFRSHHSDYFVDMQYQYLYVINKKIRSNCTINK